MQKRLRPSPLPEHAFLGVYARNGSYTDCFTLDMPGSVSHAEFVEAFYTTAVFKLERLILKWAVSRPSTDAQARQLAKGELDTFAAWSVEVRGVDQLLLCAMDGRTRSWLMAAPVEGGERATRLYFGSAVVPSGKGSSGRPRMGFAFRALLGFHKLYSRVLLGAAASRLARSTRPPS